MRYGIDLDGVCFDFLNPFRTRINNAFDWNIQQEEITSYYWYEGTDVTKEQFFSEFHKFGEEGGYRNLPLLPGTMDTLERIVNDGNEIFYITNRPEYARQDTIDALEEHGFPFRKNLFFAHGDKSSLINKLNIGVFVEDSGRTIRDIVKNTSAYTYCVDYAHNRDLEDHHNIERIKDWDDFLLAEAI
jgi:uncharacterized HAD superfamily protein